MTVPVILFYVFAALAVASALGMVLNLRNTVAGAMSLVVTMVSLAGIFVLLEAHLVAAIQIMVYGGAIVVLFLFVVMLLNAPREDAAEYDRSHPFAHPNIGRFGALLATLLIVQLVWALAKVGELKAPVGSRSDAASVGSVVEMGRVLFTRHTFAFEATSVLILVAMVGAVVLARREGSDQ